MRYLMLVMALVAMLIFSVVPLPVLAGDTPQLSTWTGECPIQPIVTQSARLGIIYPPILSPPASFKAWRMGRDYFHYGSWKIRRADSATGSVLGGHYAVILPSIASGLVSLANVNAKQYIMSTPAIMAVAQSEFAPKVNHPVIWPI